MAAVDMASSSPAPGGFANLKEEIEYYKKQYEHLESELQDFQASSRDLEAELEKDIEASEKRERSLREKVESLNYEAEEWKVSCEPPRSPSAGADGLATRPSISSPRQKRAMRRTACRKRSQLCASRTGRSNCGSAMSKWQTTTLKGRPAIRRPLSKIWSPNTTKRLSGV